MKLGRFKAKAVKGSVQFGLAGAHETPQIAIDVDMVDNGTATTFLFFSQAAAPYSFDRLKIAGWTGEGPTDLDPASKAWTLFGSTEFTVDVSEDTYQGKTRQKVEIMTGAGQVKLEKSITPVEFLARLKTLGAAPGGGGGPTSAQTGSGTRRPGDPPFIANALTIGLEEVWNR